MPKGKIEQTIKIEVDLNDEFLLREAVLTIIGQLNVVSKEDIEYYLYMKHPDGEICRNG